MSDQRNSSPSPWMRPMGAQQLIRTEHTHPEPVGPYTPNEPDQNEAIYAARAAAARQQAIARQAADDQPQSAVQQAVEQAALQAHAARQISQPQRMEPYASAPQAAQPAAVFYQQSTGVQQPVQPAQQPARPVQHHRLPMDAYPAQQPASQTAAAFVAPSRQLDASVLTDPMLMEEAQQSTSRRRRMVMRPVQELPAQPDLPQEPAPAAVEPSDPQTKETPEPKESIPAMPQLESQPDAFRQPEEEASGVEPIDATEMLTDPLSATKPMPLTDLPLPEEAPAPQVDSLSATQLDPAQPPADFFELPLENPLKEFSWYAEDVLEEDDEPEEDCMDTASMPIPTPVSTLDIPKVRHSNRLLTMLLVLMLLGAAGTFLWLSGYGQTLYHHAIKLVDRIQNDTVSTGPMSITPESAALPANLTITVTTDLTISALKLIDDSDRELPAKVSQQVRKDDTLWICSLKMEDPYSGYIRTRLLCKDDQWRTGSEKRHVELN